MIFNFDRPPLESSTAIKEFRMTESEFTCHGCGTAGRTYEAVFSKDRCKQCGKAGKDFYPDVRLSETELKSTVVVICESAGQAYAESICRQLAAFGIHTKIWTEYLQNGMDLDQIANTAATIGEKSGSTFIILTQNLHPYSKITRRALETNLELPPEKPKKVLLCPAPGFDVTELSERILKENTIVMADDAEVERLQALGKRGRIATIKSLGASKVEPQPATQEPPTTPRETHSPVETVSTPVSQMTEPAKPLQQDSLPHINPRPATEKIEVVALVCPQCGGPIDGPGKCPNCGTFLLVLENGNYLRISNEDIKDVVINRPKISSDTATWTFELKKQHRDMRFIQEDLWLIGNGNVEYGAAIVALFFKDNADRYGLPGQLVPQVDDVKKYALKAAMKQAILSQKR